MKAFSKIVVAGLVASALPALAQPLTLASPSVGGVAGAETGTLQAREDALAARLAAGIQTGAITRAQADRAASTLQSIRTQESELLQRDRVLNATDRQFISERLDELTGSLPFLQTAPLALSPQVGHAPPPPLETETPVGLKCPTHQRALLAVGRDSATASVQLSGDADIVMIAEAVAAPYVASDTLSLHVKGPGINAYVNGARAGSYLYAASTTAFSLKGRHKAVMSASIAKTSGEPHYVRIWGQCSINF